MSALKPRVDARRLQVRTIVHHIPAAFDQTLITDQTRLPVVRPVPPEKIAGRATRGPRVGAPLI
jgi:hypothetical protein